MTSQFTIEETISTIEHSQFPLLIVEGQDDIIVYRKLERDFSHFGLTVLPAFGKESILKIYRKIKIKPGIQKVVFIVDLDTWKFFGTPNEYATPQIITTIGNSIENDMFFDGNLGRLLSSATEAKFNIEIQTVCYWYALMLDRFSKGKQVEFKTHPNHLLDDADQKEVLLGLEESEVFPIELYKKIKLDYYNLLRGKTLFSTLTRHTMPGHNNRTLLDTSSAQRGPRFVSFVNSIRNYLEPEGAESS